MFASRLNTRTTIHRYTRDSAIYPYFPLTGREERSSRCNASWISENGIVTECIFRRRGARPRCPTRSRRTRYANPGVTDNRDVLYAAARNSRQENRTSLYVKDSFEPVVTGRPLLTYSYYEIMM